MTPVLLSPEEIFDRCCRTATLTVEQWRNEIEPGTTNEDAARLKGFVAAAYCNLFTALLAEIEAGRAGAERVRELEGLLRQSQATLQIADRSAVWREERDKQVNAINAALRQAAQPADGAQAVADAAILSRWNEARRLWVRGSSLCQKLALARVDELEAEGVTEADIDRLLAATTSAAPAQVGAQPAGRAEPPTYLRNELRMAIMALRRNRPGHSASDMTALVMDVIERATPPTSGAGDKEGRSLLNEKSKS